MSAAEEQLSLCRELCEDLANDLKKEGLKVGSEGYTLQLAATIKKTVANIYEVIFALDVFVIVVKTREMKEAWTEQKWTTFQSLPTTSHTMTWNCTFHCESIRKKELDGLAPASPPAWVTVIAGGNGGPLGRQRGLLSTLQMSPWELITLLWKLFMAGFSHVLWQINRSFNGSVFSLSTLLSV